MGIIVVVGIGIVAGILFLLLLRLRMTLRLGKIKDLTQYPEVFQEKFFYFKEREEQKSLISFMVIILLLCGLILGAFLSTFRLANQVEAIERKDLLSQEVVRGLFKQVETVADSEKGGLTEYSKKEEVVRNSKLSEASGILTEEERKKAEQELTKKLAPYVGQGSVHIHQEEKSGKLTLTVTGTTSMTATNVAQLSENIPALVVELESLSMVEEIHFNIKNEENPKGPSIYEETFVRSQEESRLELQKNVRKGKG